MRCAKPVLATASPNGIITASIIRIGQFSSATDLRRSRKPRAARKKTAPPNVISGGTKFVAETPIAAANAAKASPALSFGRSIIPRRQCQAVHLFEGGFDRVRSAMEKENVAYPDL